MSAIQPPPGIQTDKPPVTTAPYYASGYNIRFRTADGLPETVGFFSKALDFGELQIQIPGGEQYRSILISPSSLFSLEGGQVMFGSSERIYVMSFDPASQPTPGTRWQIDNITPVGWSSIPDNLPSPPTGGIDVPPNVAFLPQDDIVVAIKADDTGLQPHTWDRDPVNNFVTLTNAPTGAVSGAIVNRILVLLGAQSQGETDGLTDYPLRFLTVRWSNQFNFDEWDATALDSLSGELQLDTGSRIVGGGRVRQGVAAWTDEALWILSYVEDIDVVFTPKVVDGSTGLMANQAWCETEGRIWYVDTNRRLMVYDGGAPRPIPNPNKLTSIERLSTRQMARTQMWPNPEFDEVVISYPADSASDPDTQIVYNYQLDCWYPWRFRRTAWARRKANIPTIAIDHDRNVFFHDVDAGIGEPYLAPPSYDVPVTGDGLPTTVVAPAAADVEPFSFALFTNPFTSGDVVSAKLQNTRLHWNILDTPAIGATDQIDIHMIGYGEAKVRGVTITTDKQSTNTGEMEWPVRVAGKALQIGVQGDGIKTHLRFGEFSSDVKPKGPR